MPRRLSGIGIDQIGLGEGKQARQHGQPRVVQLELALDGRVVLGRVAAVERREVEHVHEQPRSLDVRQEVVPQPGAGARALDQPRNVRDDQLAILGLERSERRLERGERIVGHLRPGPGQPREQRGLARVRQPDETHVGQQLQLERDPSLVAGQPAFGEPGRLVGGAGEALVAAAARAASRHHRALPRPDQVVHGTVGLHARLRTRRHANRQGLPVPAVTQRALAVTAPAGLEVRLAPEALEIAQRVVAHEHHVAAAAAVAAVGSALGHVRFAAEAQAAVTATAGHHVDSSAVLHG